MPADGGGRTARRGSPERISTPLEWSGPPSSISRSMSSTSPRPSRTRAVIRLGLPKANSPSCSTESPLTCPTVSPSVSMSMVSRRICSWLRSRMRSARRTCASMARCTCLRGDFPAAVHTGPVVRLVKEIVDGPQAKSEPLGVGGDPGRVLDDPRGGVPRERPQPLAAGRVRDHLAVARGVAVISRQLIVEVRGHLEELGEVRVGTAQQIVDGGIAQQHHLHVERDGLRLQRDGVGEAQGLRQPMYADLVGLERALDLLPDDGLHEELARIHHQIAAVGSMQRARLDETEVGGEGAELRHLLDAADDVAVGGQILVDHGRAPSRLPLSTMTLTW